MSRPTTHDSRPTTPSRLLDFSTSRPRQEAPLWVAIPDSVLFDPELRASDIRVYAVLKRYALRYGDEQVWPSQEHIAINADCHRASLCESLAILEERGHLVRAPGGFAKTDRITITPPTIRPWSFGPSPEPRTYRKQPRRRNITQHASEPPTPTDQPTRTQMSQKATGRKTQPLMSQNPTTGVAICDTKEDGLERDEDTRDETRAMREMGDETSDRERDQLQRPTRQRASMSTHPSPRSEGPGVRELVPGMRDHGDETPYTAWAAFCEAAHLDIAAATGHEQGKALAIARHLLDDGVTVAEIAACTRYLTSQRWRTAPLSMMSLQAEVGKWRMAGRPVHEAPPPRTTYRSQADINAATGELVL